MTLLHVPVLAVEVLQGLQPKHGETVLDATLGAGGHSALLAAEIGKTGALYAFDADPENIEIAKQTLQNVECPVTIVHTNFGTAPMTTLPPFDIIFADLGLSSLHLDIAERGFSFRFDAPLDLRYDRTSGTTAAEKIATLSEEEIVKILWQYGEIEKPYKLAKVIASSTITTTFQLKAAIDTVYTFKAKLYYAQVFQAFRMYTNQELETLQTLLSYVSHLKPGGRMGIITFHSLEDRIVKHAFKEYATSTIDDYTGASLDDAAFILLTKKPICPSQAEIDANPRARSAKLRILQKK